jgi:hypothetical protein
MSASSLFPAWISMGNRVRAFSLLLGIPEEMRSGVFIAENAHRMRNPCTTLAGKML